MKVTERRLGLVVAVGLGLMQGIAWRIGLDFRDYDDLVRSVLARSWAARPFFLPGDGYWPSLPFIVRGAALRLVPPSLTHPELALVLMRLVTLAYLWGCWRLLVAALRQLGGGGLAAGLFTAMFLLNGGTFHFAASTYSEPDCLFWLLAGLIVGMRGLATDRQTAPSATRATPQSARKE